MGIAGRGARRIYDERGQAHVLKVKLVGLTTQGSLGGGRWHEKAALRALAGVELGLRHLTHDSKTR